jgi:hypothetical protein
MAGVVVEHLDISRNSQLIGSEEQGQVLARLPVLLLRRLVKDPAARISGNRVTLT